MLLGVDTGGTFTDFVLLKNGEISTHKVLSCPSAPEKAILQGIEAMGLTRAVSHGELVIIHGSTVATNAALEGKGVRTVYITNRGFEDTLQIGRQTRRELYQLTPTALEPPVPPILCLGTGGRLSAEGETIEPLTPQDLEQLQSQLKALQPEAVAINLLFSFLDDRFEKAIEAIVAETVFCSRSSFVLPEYKEYERGIATWLNAWLGPVVYGYLNNLQNQVSPSPLTLMQSSGGTIAADQAAHRAINLLLSGPAGGLAGALYIGDITDSKRLLTFDMGGTSTDVALLDGKITLTNEGRIANYPVAVPMVNMHTIGAGGGSIAYLDEGNVLRVGPSSAGADPGPACYGGGGQHPTVTDANVILGRLQPDNFLGGSMSLDLMAARQAMAEIAHPLSLSIEEAALGIITIANEHMARALRVISVQRGYDPADFVLCCFGGAGGLHLCALAKELGMNKAIVPLNAGVLSAFGMLVAPRERQLSRSKPGLLTQPTEKLIEKEIATLRDQGIKQLQAEGIDQQAVACQPSLDLRYQGQSYTLNILWENCQQASSEFHRQHERHHGHRLNFPIELVNVRVALTASSHHIELPGAVTENKPVRHLPMYGIDGPVTQIPRNAMPVHKIYTGPLLITEENATTFVALDWQVHRDDRGNLILDMQSDKD